MNFLSLLFDTADFPARWHCGRWTATHGWLHIISDLGVWSAYLAIPLVLIFFLMRRKDLPFRKIFLLFGAFILACGTTHLMEAIIFWWPAYRLAGVIKLFTALVSWTTVFALIQIVPKALTLRSPEELEREIAARQKAENALQRANSELEGQVKALRHSEEQFRLLVEGTKDHAMFLLDKNGNISSWNSGAERVNQFRADEVIGRHFSCFYTTEDIQSDKPEQELKRADSEGSFDDQGWRVRKDGTRYFANIVVTALRDEMGNLRGFSKVIHDVTEKKQAEENERRLLQEEAARKAAEVQAQIIEEQRERLRVTLASIGDAVISTDAEGHVTFLNSVAENLTGWTSSESTEKKLIEVFNILNEQTRQPLENPAMRAIREGVIVGLANHTILVARDGTERPIDDSAAPIRDSSGKILGSVLVFRDVARQRRDDTANRLLAQVSGALVGPLHYQSILRHVAELTVPTLGDMCFFDVLSSDDQLHRVGWKHVDPAKTELSEKVLRFVPSLHSANHPVSQVLHTGQSVLLADITDSWRQSVATSAEHLEFLRGLGICSMLSVPMLVGERRLGALTFAYSDSGRHHTADDLALAEEIARRTALTVENSKLFNQLHDANQKKNEFLAILAHELRNPLAPITNALQIMRITGNRAEEIGPLREMMERQVRQMVHLVDDLLDVSRITSGKIVLRNERLNLSAVVNTTLEASHLLIEAAKHDLTVSLPPLPLFVIGDKTRLVQVLSNLLANAVKYTPEGGRIWLTVSRRGQDAMIQIQDTGLGIPAEMMPRIFEMFTQVDRNLGRSQGGLGIGLTLVRSLVAMHGGTIEAHSDGPGRGSEFTVRIPLASDDSIDQKGLGTTDTTPAVNRLPCWRVLVVDDNKDSAESLGKLVRIMGNDVKIAYDGPSALEAGAEFRPHIVLLDIGLPGISGYDVARRMRQMPELKDALLVAQTGWGQEEDKRRSVEAGFNAHLVKPVDVVALQKILDEFTRAKA